MNVYAANCGPTPSGLTSLNDDSLWEANRNALC